MIISLAIYNAWGNASEPPGGGGCGSHFGQIYLKICHDRFFANPCQFAIHNHALSDNYITY
jgi:hypothetical protein